jgi:hypothetical protein
VELTHRGSKALYPRINKHEPERDIGRLHRRGELIHYMDPNRTHKKAPNQVSPDSRERYKMSEGASSYVNLREFLRVPRGAVPDPAKKVCPLGSSGM